MHNECFSLLCWKISSFVESQLRCGEELAFKMPLYKIYKLRILVFLIIFIISLFSVFLLQTDVLSDQFNNDVNYKLNNNWGYFLIKSSKSVNDVTVNDGKDYDNYGPEDIIADDNESDDEVPNENGVFKPEDFDLNLLNSISNRFIERRLRGDDKSIASTTLPEFRVPPVNLELTNNFLFNSTHHKWIENKVFWSEYLENLMPKGSDDESVGRYLSKIQKDKVVRVQPPSWDRCGRPKNQFITLSSGEHLCARYRDPHNYLVQGEVLSFYFSRLLGIHNTPIVTLSHVSSDSPQWLVPAVKHSVKAAGWKMNTTIAFIQWIDGLERSRMPQLIKEALIKLDVITAAKLLEKNLTLDQIIELMQWGDLILFDYITGHYDRVASMQDAALKEQRSSILEETVHNLVKSQKNHGLWLIDNESGILDGYTLMYSSTSNLHRLNDKQRPDDSGNQFIKFHEQMLHLMCIFRRPIANRISWLHRQENPLKVLINLVEKYEPYFENSQSILENVELVGHFKERITNVYNRIQECGIS